MTDRSRTTGDDRSQDAGTGFSRRRFVALGAGASATLLAGCTGDGGLPSTNGSAGSAGSETLTGNFRLLISDAPADIADFDQLNVTLGEARIFEARDDDDEEEDDDEEDDKAEDDDEEAENGEQADQTGNETDAETDSPNGTAEEDAEDEDAEDEDAEDEDAEDEDAEDEDAEDEDAEDDEAKEEDDDDESDDDDDRGFTVVDLGGATVDLTQVIEEDAKAVFDGEIPAGSYEKIELAVTGVEGIVDGETVDVKLPSEKLRITNAFEVTADEPVSFVFDINVVKRGPNNGYILKPVISGSGVAGRDVDVNEIDDGDDDDGEDDDDDDDGEDDDDDDDDNEGSEDGESDGEDGDSGTEDDGEDESRDDGGEAGGNQTDGTDNETATGS